MHYRKVMRPPLTLLLRKPLLILKLLLLRVNPKKKLELKTRYTIIDDYHPVMKFKFFKSR